MQIKNNGKTPTEPSATDIQNPVAVVINRRLDQTATPATGQPDSISVSEPVLGYDSIATAGATWNPPSAMYPEGAYSPAFDTPIDQSNTVLTGVNLSGTTPSFRYIHLQRLANPLVAWNLTTNPYLTVDTMPVALTVFNGATNAPGDSDGTNTTGIASFQRGDTDNNYNNNLWRRESAVTPIRAAVAGSATHNFDFVLQHSLGYLNTNYGDYSTGTAYKQSTAPVPAYAGAPNSLNGTQPFPWFNWNNRPFVSPLELMQVPKSRSSRVLADYSPFEVNSGNPSAPQGGIYSGVTNLPPLPYSGHLWDLFQSVAPTAGNPPATTDPRLYGILEYVQVPSPFVGTETELNPQTFSTTLHNEQASFSLFHPPFNKVSNYRDPGRININTIPSDNASNSTSSVWNAILSGRAVSWPIVVREPTARWRDTWLMADTHREPVSLILWRVRCYRRTVPES